MTPALRTRFVSRASFGLVCALAMTTQWNAIRIGRFALEDVLMALAFGALAFELCSVPRWPLSRLL